MVELSNSTWRYNLSFNNVIKYTGRLLEFDGILRASLVSIKSDIDLFFSVSTIHRQTKATDTDNHFAEQFPYFRPQQCIFAHSCASCVPVLWEEITITQR